MEQSSKNTGGALLIGRYVGKVRACASASAKGKSKLILGKITSYEETESSGLFAVSYEDGCREHLDRGELEKILLAADDKRASYYKKRKLDKMITDYGGEAGSSKRPNTRSSRNRNNTNDDNTTPPIAADDRAQPSPPVSSQPEASDDADDTSSSSSGDSCGPPPDLSSLPDPPPILPLPPSSGDLNVPEESVPHLFSVYNFLRSFSLQLFLSPFGLDDFIGCLDCTVQNSLMDAVHLTLMRALRRHLLFLSSDGSSEMAPKCLRHCDWTLLDALTWPAILVEYLFVMGYIEGLFGKGFNFCVSAGEYYGLPVTVKLRALQILCDDVIGSAELRTELDTRVGTTEDGDGYDAGVNILAENGTRRVPPRFSKTFEVLDNSVQSKLMNLDSKTLEMVDASPVGQDGNSDECCLCGMNGSLVCCDGCPSAYHVRCIGLYKSFLPDGLWFCPECNVNKLGATSSRICRGANGAEIFGTDANGRVFLGTCNYLLVIGASSNSESDCRYYNQDDVLKVLTTICLTTERVSGYVDICRGISSYWAIPLITMQSGKPEPTMDPQVDKEFAMAHIASSTILPKGTDNTPNGEDVDMMSLAEGSSDNRAVACQKDCYTEPKANSSSLELLDKIECTNSEKRVTTSQDVCTKETPEAADKTLCPVKERQFISGSSPFTHTMIRGKLGSESVVMDNMSYSNTERLVFLDTATCALGNENGMCKEDARSSTFSTKMESVNMSSESRTRCQINNEKDRFKSQTNSNIQSVYKPQAYINLYVQGDLAASAASILAVQASEENKVSEAYVSSNPRKVMPGTFALETKAFCMATSEFLWPSFDKLAENPRAKCGWCSACGVSYKKGCLLNLAANKSTKRFARNASALRPNKPIDSHIPTIAAQIAHMEERLQGLVAGPLLHATYKKQWYKIMREASSCRALKFLLLELEKSIRGISFSAEWTKLVDDLGEFSSDASGACRAGPAKKHGLGGRRRKQYLAAETEPDSSSDSSNTLQWWRGGRFSKVVFQKRALNSSLVKKAGRQGGFKRIPGVHYPEVSGFPRRSRQLAWRASVQMSKNVSQLALQVRCLDAHIRWRDLVRPEENPSDGKGSDVDATAFRNAVICDKRITENKISYALTFHIQKHLPIRVAKNILETEKNLDGHDKSWFSEHHVPLYLIKEYEEKAGAKPLTCSPLNCPEMLRLHGLPSSKMRQMKGQEDIFSYLIWKRDAVRCNTCRVYYQKDCTITSPASKEGDMELFQCTKCYRVKFDSLVGSSKQNASKQLPLLGQNYHQSIKGQNYHQPLKGQNQQCPQRLNQQPTSTKCILKMGHHVSMQPFCKKEVPSEMWCSASGSKAERKRATHSSEYGLIWKRTKSDGPGKDDFRINHIILKKKEGINPSRDVICCLCSKPYCADLMYVSCELCNNWYHADAVQLEEAQAFDLVGFKCCRCQRKKRLPKCPYSDYTKPDVEQWTPVNVERSEDPLSKAQEVVHSSTSEFNLKLEDFNVDPLLYSLGKVEPIEEATLDTQVYFDEPRHESRNQQKLSVRRSQVKHEKDTNEFCVTQRSNCVEFSDGVQSQLFSGNPAEGGTHAKELLTTKKPNLTTEMLSTAQVEWDSSRAWDYGDADLDSMDLADQLRDPEIGISDMEFEPQTYFSFTELLDSDDAQIGGQYDMPANMSVDWSLDNSGTTCQDVRPYGSSGAHEMLTNDQFSVSNGTVLEGASCGECKFNQPSPDLVCEICKICIHSHCSPWGDNVGAQWRCGSCRDWQ